MARDPLVPHPTPTYQLVIITTTFPIPPTIHVRGSCIYFHAPHQTICLATLTRIFTRRIIVCVLRLVHQTVVTIENDFIILIERGGVQVPDADSRKYLFFRRSEQELRVAR